MKRSWHFWCTIQLTLFQHFAQLQYVVSKRKDLTMRERTPLRIADVVVAEAVTTVADAIVVVDVTIVAAAVATEIATAVDVATREVDVADQIIMTITHRA